MKRHALCLLFALAATAAPCAPTAWEYCWTYMHEEEFGKKDMLSIDGAQNLLEFQALLLPDGSRGLIQYSGGYMEYEHRTALAAPGDFIDGDYFENHEWLYDEMFFREGYEPEQQSILRQGESTFVAIQTEYFQAAGTPRIEYGYMELTLDPNSDVVVLSAFTEFEPGQGLFVIGPTPEPTSGLMLLIGLAGLALKRKQA